MKLNEINLAREPFRRDRPLLVASAAVAALEMMVLVLLLLVGVADRSQTAEIRGAMNEVEKELQQVSSEAAELESVLNQPQNAAVLGRGQFLNTLLLRKGISWTRIFDDLEGVLPYNVQLISVRPQVDLDNDVVLDMVVGAQDQNAVIRMLQRFEDSKSFGETFVHNYLPPSQNEPLYRYRVSVRYGQQL